jgi:hypothetical protein
MNKPWILPFFLVLVTALFLTASCGNAETCDGDPQSYMLARFRTLYDGEIRDTALTDFSLYGIREGKADSLIYLAASLGTMEVPLNPHSELTRFVITAGENRDTLVLEHQSEVYLISVECGFASRFTVNSVNAGGGLIKDLDLREKQVDAESLVEDAHIWIYF